MKTRIFFFLLVLGAGLWYYDHTHRPPAPPSAERQPRLAPEGVFYFTDYVSLRTTNGVIGFEPGQEVRVVRGLKSTLIVAMGNTRLRLDPTNSRPTLTLQTSFVAAIRQRKPRLWPGTPRTMLPT